MSSLQTQAAWLIIIEALRANVMFSVAEPWQSNILPLNVNAMFVGGRV